MSVHVLIITTLLCVLPVSELRGALPYALYQGIPLPLAYLYCVVLNALVGPFVFLFLTTFHRWLIRYSWYERFIGHFIAKARVKVGSHVQKYGYLGLSLFVAIPLPVTGAYTGAIGAWILGLDRKRSFLAIAAGVCIAGIIITLVSVLGIEALSIFIKRPEVLNGN